MLNSDDGVLVLQPVQIDYHYDELDSNAINFQLVGGYLSIQTSIYLEDDDELNEPFIEFGCQDRAQVGGLRAIYFSPQSLEIRFKSDRLFLGRYSVVRLNFGSALDRKLVDFFVNSLFLGEIVEYSGDFDSTLMCTASAVRERL